MQWKDYNAKLESYNLIVKARNFLVFQGDVEAIAQKTPAELTALFENISGSAELKEEYERLKREKQVSEEQLKMAQAKKKSFTSEKKQYVLRITHSSSLICGMTMMISHSISSYSPPTNHYRYHDQVPLTEGRSREV